jgi:thioredoxin-like negative regulator of GroEL
MSMSPDELVNLLSRWLARHVSDDDLRAALADVRELSEDQREAVDDLRAQLDSPDGRGEVERAVREALEALALG